MGLRKFWPYVQISEAFLKGPEFWNRGLAKSRIYHFLPLVISLFSSPFNLPFIFLLSSYGIHAYSCWPFATYHSKVCAHWPNKNHSGQQMIIEVWSNNGFQCQEALYTLNHILIRLAQLILQNVRPVTFSRSFCFCTFVWSALTQTWGKCQVKASYTYGHFALHRLTLL